MRSEHNFFLIFYALSTIKASIILTLLYFGAIAVIIVN